MPTPKQIDNDSSKGAVEEEFGVRSRGGNPNLHCQLGHLDQDEMLKDADSDFPEPGSNPEHSGQHR
jgi:hypothetical protein